MKDKERQLDRVLTKIEKLETLGENSVMIVLPGWMVLAISAAGYAVGQCHHCRQGIWWYTVSWRRRCETCKSWQWSVCGRPKSPHYDTETSPRTTCDCWRKK